MNKSNKNKYLIAASFCVLMIIGVLVYYFFSPCSAKKVTSYLYIDNDDTADSVVAKVTPMVHQRSLHGLTIMMRHSGYDKKIRTGRYAITTSETTFTLFRRLKNGLQDPVNLTVPSVRTMDRLAAELSKKLMPDSLQFIQTLKDQKVCQELGYDTATIACMFIPNTYDIYWNVSTDQFMKKMKKENDAFWNNERKEKAERLKLSPNQVYIIASIIDEETANDGEKPMIAGMYYNRLRFRDSKYPNGMPLQADPTIKFALKDFKLRRIYEKLLFVKSPYNTYTNPGLPPGPIRIASVAGIDAVLNMIHHDYLYMCANSNFSGTHVFAHTYEEHMVNAAKYSEALNKRGIK